MVYIPRSTTLLGCGEVGGTALLGCGEVGGNFITFACHLFVQAGCRPIRVFSLINQVVKLWSISQSSARELLLRVIQHMRTQRRDPGITLSVCSPFDNFGIDNWV